jgi:hypothetical protein
MGFDDINIPPAPFIVPVVPGVSVMFMSKSKHKVRVL